MLDVVKKAAGEKRSGKVQIGVRLPPPMVEEIDRMVADRNERAGWDEVNRSDIIRELCAEGLERRRTSTEKKPTGKR